MTAPSTSPPAPGSALPAQYLTFRIADEEYAIGILRVREIIEFTPLTTVPGSPACVRGVMNLRGSVVPVVDLPVRFGREPSRVTSRTCIIIVELTASEDGPSVMGVIADAVSEVVDLPAEAIQPPPAFGTRLAPAYLQGMGQSERGFMLLLDVDRALALEDLDLPLAADVAAADVAGSGAPESSAESRERGDA